MRALILYVFLDCYVVVLWFYRLLNPLRGVMLRATAAGGVEDFVGVEVVVQVRKAQNHLFACMHTKHTICTKS